MAIFIPNGTSPILLIHIPKTGGSSILRWIQVHGIPHLRLSNHATYREVVKRSELPSETSVVTVVRNPFSRLVSIFEFVNSRATLRSHKRQTGERVQKRFQVAADNEIMEYYQRGFRNWVSDLYQGKTTPYDHGLDRVRWNWTTPQTFWTDEPDVAMRTESLDSDFQVLSRLLGVYEPLVKENTGEYRNRRTHYYDQNTLDMVHNIFLSDFLTWGYEKNFILE